MIRVVKIGGSLFDWPGLRAGIHSWLAKELPAVNAFLAGGGALVETIRRLDRVHQLGEERCHWLAIEAMSVTAQATAAIFPEFRLVTEYHALEAAAESLQNANLIFDAREFLVRHEPHLPGQRLSHSWSVTSDSIAARLAEVLAADELVVLKSSFPPPDSFNDLSQLASCGYVDRHFPFAVINLPPPRFVNLRGGGS